MNYRKGLVALSADPIHYGHLDLITEAKKRCNKLFVLISNNDQKKGSYTFNLSARTVFARKLLEGLHNVEVIEPPTQVLADTYLRYNCDVIFRGIRNAVDYEYENTQMGYHKLVYSDFNSEFIEAQGEHKIVSSSLIKAFTSHHIDVIKFVPMFIKRALEERINKQYKIAVTGEMAIGKSWVTDQLVKIINHQCLNLRIANNFAGKLAKAIKIDDLIRSLYEDDIPGAQEMRRNIQEAIGHNTVVLDSEGRMDRKALGDFMFSDHCKDDMRETIQNLTTPFIHMLYREALTGFQGIVIVEWAMLSEMGMEDWTSNKVIVVESSNRKEFIKKRKLTDEQIKGRGKYQWTADEKVAALLKSIKRDGEGNIIRFTNSLENNKIKDLANEVLNLFK